MPVSFSHLVGDIESIDKTIWYHVTLEWDNSNTNSITPVFENGIDEPDYIAQFDRSGPNKILFNSINKLTEDKSDQEVNSDTIHAVEEEILITIVAESREARYLFENEINRIIWELSPNSSIRLTKSGDVEDSHVDHFKKSEVQFNEIELPNNETAYLIGSEGTLTCIYYKFRT
jgi:hypothetical protein